MSGDPITLRPAGLFLDPNPHSEVPDGALEVADNVVIRKKGKVQPRPGLETKHDFANWAEGTRYPVRLMPFRDNAGNEAVYGLFYSTVSNNFVFRKVTDVATDILDANSNDPVCTLGEMQFENYNGQLYFTTNKGVYYLNNTSGTTLRAAGWEQAKRPDISSSTEADWLEDGETVGYRLVYYRETDAKQRVASAPSSVVWFKNEDGAARGASLLFFLPDFIQAGDHVELYRTFISETYAGVQDDYYLAKDHLVTSADISEGKITITDDTPQTRLGAALYTNLNQESILASNFSPPQCTDVAEFKGMMLYANAKQRHQVKLQLKEDLSYVGLTGETATIVDAGGGTGTVVTGITSTADLRAGMVITDRSSGPGSAGILIPANTTIASVDSSTQITLSQAATAGIWNNIYAGEMLTLDDTAAGGATTRFYAWNSFGTTENTFDIATYATGWFQLMDLARLIDQKDLGFQAQMYVTAAGDEYTALRSTVNRDFGTFVSSLSSFDSSVPLQLQSQQSIRQVITQRTTGEFVLVRETLENIDSEFTLELHRPGAWAATLDSSNQLTSSNNARPNRIYVSKLLEQEHVPLTSYVDVGPDGTEVYRVLPSGEGAIVFAESGIHLLTGYSPSSLRLDQLHKTARLVHPNAACSVQGQVFALTTEGALLVSPQGVTNVSETPIGDTIAPVVEAMAAATKNRTGFFCAADPIEREVVLGIPAATAGTEDSSSTVYRFNLGNLAWTTISRQGYDVVFNPDDQRLWFGIGSGEDPDGVLAERSLEDSYFYCDESYSVTVASIDNAIKEVTISGGSNWTPAVGDVLSQGGTDWIVDSVDSATVFTVTSSTATMSAAAATAYEAYTADVAFTARSWGDPSRMKLISGGFLYFDDFGWVALYDLILGAPGVFSDNTVSVSQEPYNWPSAAPAGRQKNLRFDVPRSLGFVESLAPRFKVKNGLQRWELSMLKLFIRDSYEVGVRNNSA